MSKVFLVRHGQTLWNREARFQGRKDSPLSDLGRNQTQVLAREMAHGTWGPLPRRIFCSSAGRARESASLLVATWRELNQTIPAVEYLDELQEMHLGSWEGLLKCEIEKRDGENYVRFRKDPLLFRSPGGESYRDLERRIRTFWESRKETMRAESCLILSHGVWLQTLFRWHMKWPWDDLWMHGVLHQSALSILEFGSRSRLVVRNDRRHLASLRSDPDPSDLSI